MLSCQEGREAPVFTSEFKQPASNVHHISKSSYPGITHTFPYGFTQTDPQPRVCFAQECVAVPRCPGDFCMANTAKALAFGFLFREWEVMFLFSLCLLIEQNTRVNSFRPMHIVFTQLRPMITTSKQVLTAFQTNQKIITHASAQIFR